MIFLNIIPLFIIIVICKMGKIPRGENLYEEYGVSGLENESIVIENIFIVQY